MTRITLVLSTLLMVLTASMDYASGEDAKPYRFRPFPGDVSRLTPLDLQAPNSTLPSCIGGFNWGGWKWYSEWTRNKLNWSYNRSGLIEWNLRSTGGPDLLADLLEEDLSGSALYSYEEPFVKECLSRMNGQGRDRAQVDLEQFLWRGARMNVRAPLVVKHAGVVTDEQARSRALDIARDAERFGIRDYTLPWLAAWDSMRFVFLCQSASTLDRRLVPVLMLYLTHRDPPIRDAAAKTISYLTRQVWVGRHDTPIEERRVRFVEWWKEHRKEPMWKWYAEGMPPNPFAELAARADFGDMEAVGALARRLSRMTVEEFRATEDFWVVHGAGISWWELQRHGYRVNAGPPPRNAPIEVLNPWLDYYRGVMASFVKSFDPKKRWLEWEIEQGEREDGYVDVWKIKARTNHTFGMDALMPLGGDDDGWETRLDKVPRLVDDPEAWEAKKKAEKELMRMGIAEMRRWLQGEGKDWSYEKDDAIRIQDQIDYEKYLRHRFPDLFARLEGPARPAPRTLFSQTAYELFDIVMLREQVARYQVRIDNDHDGRGEFFRLWDGPNRFWEAKRLEKHRLGVVQGHPDLAEWDSVLLRAFVPDSTDGAEQHFACIAWPTEDPGPGRRTAGLLLDDGRLFASREPLSLGLHRIPDLSDLFAVGEEWKSPRADLWEETEWPTDYWR